MCGSISSIPPVKHSYSSVQVLELFQCSSLEILIIITTVYSLKFSKHTNFMCPLLAKTDVLSLNTGLSGLGTHLKI